MSAFLLLVKKVALIIGSWKSERVRTWDDIENSWDDL